MPTWSSLFNHHNLLKQRTSSSFKTAGLSDCLRSQLLEKLLLLFSYWTLKLRLCLCQFSFWLIPALSRDHLPPWNHSATLCCSNSVDAFLLHYLFSLLSGVWLCFILISQWALTLETCYSHSVNKLLVSGSGPQTQNFWEKQNVVPALILILLLFIFLLFKH